MASPNRTVHETRQELNAWPRIDSHLPRARRGCSRIYFERFASHWTRENYCWRDGGHLWWCRRLTVMGGVRRILPAKTHGIHSTPIAELERKEPGKPKEDYDRKQAAEQAELNHTFNEDSDFWLQFHRLAGSSYATVEYAPESGTQRPPRTVWGGMLRTAPLVRRPRTESIPADYGENRPPVGSRTVRRLVHYPGSAGAARTAREIPDSDRRIAQSQHRFVHAHLPAADRPMDPGDLGVFQQRIRGWPPWNWPARIP